LKNMFFKYFIILACLVSPVCGYAQDSGLEYTLDANSATIALPRIFKPGMDLSGRGFNQDFSWPQGLASKDILDLWQKDIGLSGVYRVQYNFWEISQLAKDKTQQEKLINNYNAVIKAISDSGGTVILDIFSTPPGLGKALDKKSAPWDIKAFKELTKSLIRELSCEKKYNVWYEVWSAPDLDAFFLGRKIDYLNLYKAVAESVLELEKETKINIPLGGPGASWWFQNFDGNSIITPERSLVYELIRFCYHYHLPLDFISWHAYSSDPKVEKEITFYNKTATALVRDWLTYFNFDRSTPLVVGEWNYDTGQNVLSARKEKSFITASYIPARLSSMYSEGLDYQSFYSLQDFHNSKEGVIRNTGAFWFEDSSSQNFEGQKSIYNIFKMLSGLGNQIYPASLKINDGFLGLIASKTDDGLAIIVYNYIDPDIALNYVSRYISTFSPKEALSISGLVKSGAFDKIIRKDIDFNKLILTSRVKELLRRALEAGDKARLALSSNRIFKLNIKGLKEDYVYQRYVVDEFCSINCAFLPIEEKIVKGPDAFQEKLILTPYSVSYIVLKKKPLEAAPESPIPAEEKLPEAVKEEPKQINTKEVSVDGTTG